MLVQSAFTPSFVRKLDENPARAGDEDTNRRKAKDFAVDILNLNSTLTPQLIELVNACIAINSTAFEDIDSKSGATVFIRNKTETALLKFAKDLGWANYKAIRDAADVVLITYWFHCHCVLGHRRGEAHSCSRGHRPGHG